MKKNKKVLSVAGLALCALLMTACGDKKDNNASENGEKKQTIEFWTISLQPTFNDYFDELIADFEKENENITVEWKDYPLDTLQNKLLTAVASDNAPDVVNLSNELVLQMAGKNALADVDPLLSSDAKDSFIEGIYDSTTIDDSTYGVPWYTSVPIIFMNKDLVEKANLDVSNPPKDMDEYLEWGKQISEKEGVPSITVIPEAKLYAYEGVPVINEDGNKAVFNDEAGVQMVEKYKEIIDEGYAPKELINFDKQVQLMATESTAMIIAGTTFINKIKTTAPDVFDKIICSPTPVGQTGSRISSSMFLSITEKSKHKDAATKFTTYLTNAANQLEFSKLANTLPSTKESIKDEYFTTSDGSIESEARIASASGLDKAREYSLNVANTTGVNTAVKKALEEIFINGQDIEETLDNAATEVDQIIK